MAGPTNTFGGHADRGGGNPAIGATQQNYNLPEEDIQAFLSSSSGGGISADTLRQARRYVDAGGNEIGSTNPGEISAYVAWKQKLDKSNEVHDEYVKLMQDKPGRNATILTHPEAKTVLG